MDRTYTQAVLEGDAADGEGLKEFRHFLAVGLRVGCCSRGRVLGGSEVRDALSGLDVVRGMHFMRMDVMIWSCTTKILTWNVSTLNTTHFAP